MDEITRYEQMKQEVIAIINEQIAEYSEQWKEVKKTVSNLSRRMRTQEEEITLTPAEALEISNRVKKKGVQCMGGLKSPAYKDKNLRRRVYQDIYYQIKREYGLIDEKGAQLSYKYLKRKFFKGALITVQEYETSIALQNDIDAINEIGMDDDE